MHPVPVAEGACRRLTAAPPVSAIREAARLAVEAGSLRSVARAIGMSPMGLKHFLEGRRPYSATVRKLNAWYVVHQADSRGFSADAARGALALLLDGVPEPQRARGSALLLDDLRRFHQTVNTRPPDWLEALLAEFRAESGLD